MPGRVEGKTLLIMGGGQTPGETIGNGCATAELLAREGARVLVVDRDLSAAEQTVEAIRADGGDATPFAADITAEEDVQAAIAACIDTYDRIDLLHNNIGASLALGDAVATDLEVEAFDRLYQVNLRGMWLACKHALPHMREQRSGSIVNISTFAAFEPDPVFPTSGVFRAGLAAFTKLFADKYAADNIRMNNVLPGFIDSLPENADFKARIPMERYGKTEEISILALNLLWKPTGDMIRFVLAVTSRGPIVLMCSDLNQDPNSIFYCKWGRSVSILL